MNLCTSYIIINICIINIIILSVCSVIIIIVVVVIVIVIVIVIENLNQSSARWPYFKLVEPVSSACLTSMTSLALLFKLVKHAGLVIGLRDYFKLGRKLHREWQRLIDS